MTSFNRGEFESFCRALRIDSKERGIIRLGENLLGTQRRLLDEMAEGMERGVRNFVTLKCRQIGVSTVSLALDLYWIFKHKGLNGALVVHDDAARESFRSTLAMYYDGLPAMWKRPLVAHNRNHMVFNHASRLMFKVAGTKATGGGSLGRSAALPFIHATEMSSWGDEEGLESLRSAMAESNPIRLYHWESTARGFNMFEDMWQMAKRAKTQKAIFISFWSNEFYRAEKGSDVYKHYWGVTGRPSAEEREWMRAVKSLYGHEIDAPCLAWYRWMGQEKIGDPGMLMQEFPPTEEMAFIATGTQFFTSRSISDTFKSLRHVDTPRYFRIDIGKDFSSTQVIEVPERIATLRVWEEPDKRGKYVLGADPAYGSSDWADRFCISVWRCYADRMVQVAEFVDPDMATYSFAWVMAYLAGAYEPCLVNLELNGPGQAVLTELQNLRKISGAGKHNPESTSLMNVTRHTRNYLFRRLDSLGGGPSALHTLSSYQVKERMMNTFRDYFERDIIQIRSKGLVEEMSKITRQEGSAPSAAGKNKDDRVIAAALAVTAWNDQLRTQLMMENQTYELVERAKVQTPIQSVTARTLDNYLQLIGVKARPQVGKRTAGAGRAVGRESGPST